MKRSLFYLIFIFTTFSLFSDLLIDIGGGGYFDYYNGISVIPDIQAKIYGDKYLTFSDEWSAYLEGNGEIEYIPLLNDLSFLGGIGGDFSYRIDLAVFRFQMESLALFPSLTGQPEFKFYPELFFLFGDTGISFSTSHKLVTIWGSILDLGYSGKLEVTIMAGDQTVIEPGFAACLMNAYYNVSPSLTFTWYPGLPLSLECTLGGLKSFSHSQVDSAAYDYWELSWALDITLFMTDSLQSWLDFTGWLRQYPSSLYPNFLNGFYNPKIGLEISLSEFISLKFITDVQLSLDPNYVKPLIQGSGSILLGFIFN